MWVWPAPQVGILRRIVVIEQEDGEILELVNPRSLPPRGSRRTWRVGLSVPGVWGEVKRPMTVTVRALDRNGEPFEKTASGLIGRCFVHECEHLDGILFVDRADRLLTEEELAQLEAEARENAESEEEQA